MNLSQLLTSQRQAFVKQLTCSVVFWEGFDRLGGIKSVIVVDEGLCGILVVRCVVDRLLLVPI